jgi:hypothetical protein
MAHEGWPMFAEQRARKALPWYGGNKIPSSHLAKFTLRDSNQESGLPAAIDSFTKEL